MRQPVLLAAYTLLGLASCGCLGGAPSPRKDAVVESNPTPVESEQKTRAQKPDSDNESRPSPPPVQDPNAPRATLVTQARAVVGDVPILNDEVEYQMVHLGFRPDQPMSPERLRDLERQALEKLIDREILMQHIEAMLHGPGEKLLEQLRKESNKEFDKVYVFPLMKRENLVTEEDFQDFLHNHPNQIPLELMRRDFQRNAIVSQFLYSVISPHYNTIDRRMIQEYYDVHTEEFRIADSVDWQVLFLFCDDRYANRQAAFSHAQVVAQRARDGEEFGALVAQFDNGLHKGSKGEGMGHRRGEIQPALLEKDLFEMRENEVRVVPSETGHYVIRLVKRVRAGRRPFDAKVQKEIQTTLKRKVEEIERDALIKELKKKIPWTILDAQGNAVQPAHSRDHKAAPTSAP